MNNSLLHQLIFHFAHAGESQLTDLHPPRVIPDRCYDCGDGFYDPATRVITSYTDKFLRNAGERENIESNYQNIENNVLTWICNL